MGDLARQRSARDLWISRGHVRAMATGTLVLAATAFVVGFAIGRDTTPVAETEASRPADGDLVELLARVESASRPHGGIEALTFPDALSGIAPSLPAAPPGSDGLEETAPVALIEPSIDAEPLVGDAPVGRFALEVGRFENGAEAAVLREKLRAADLDAWIALELVDGRPVHHVAIGGWADEAAAVEAATELGPRITALGSGEPEIYALP